MAKRRPEIQQCVTSTIEPSTVATTPGTLTSGFAEGTTHAPTCPASRHGTWSGTYDRTFGAASFGATAFSAPRTAGPHHGGRPAGAVRCGAGGLACDGGP